MLRILILLTLISYHSLTLAYISINRIFPTLTSSNILPGSDILLNLVDSENIKIPIGPPSKPSNSYIYFTGAGVYFWWQAGAGKYIQRNYDIKNHRLVGASAGSLTALLLKCDCDFDQAAAVALRLANEANVFGRKGGMFGILSGLLRSWLEEMVPDDITPEKLSNLYISLTPVGKKPYLVTDFANKEDVINACMASCHVPVFLDGKVVSEYRGDQVIDGSFWYFVNKDRFNSLPLLPDAKNEDIVWVDYGDDNIFMNSISGNFLETISPTSLYSMMARGYDYMESKNYKNKELLTIKSPIQIEPKMAIKYFNRLLNGVGIIGA